MAIIGKLVAVDLITFIPIVNHADTSRPLTDFTEIMLQLKCNVVFTYNYFQGNIQAISVQTLAI